MESEPKKFHKGKEGIQKKEVGGVVFPVTVCVCVCVCVRARARSRGRSVAQSCPILCDPMDCSPPGSSVHGIFWSALPFPSLGDLCHPGIQPMPLAPSALAGRFFTTATSK